MEETTNQHKEKSQGQETVAGEDTPGTSVENVIIPEDPKEREQRIKELKETIQEVLAEQERIAAMQRSYTDIPDEALTDKDREVKHFSVAPLQEELNLLEQAQRASSSRGILKKIAAFLSF